MRKSEWYHGLERHIRRHILAYGMLKEMKKAIPIIILFSLIGAPAGSIHSNHTMNSVLLASPRVSTTNVNDSLWAYAIANSNASQGFEGSTILGQTVYLPSHIIYYVISAGVSSVSISVNGVSVITGQPFSNFMQDNMTLPYGIDNVTFNIQSSQLNAARSITYSINVVITATYISYLKTKQPSQLPLITLAAAFGITAGAAFLIPFMVLWWKGLFDYRERKRGPITR